MRVLFAIDPSVAHLYPMVPTAWALQSAGHEVRLASFASFADSIAATGLTPVALGDPDAPPPFLDDNAATPRLPEEVDHFADVLGFSLEDREHWYLFYQYFLTPIADYLRESRREPDDLVAFARSWRPDLVIWDFTQYAGPIAARVCGAAHARLLPGRDNFGFSLNRLAQRRAQVLAAGLDENPLATLVRPVAQRHGVEVDDELLLGQWTIDPFLPGLGLPTSTLKVPVRYIPYSGASTVPRWLYDKPRRPRIAMTLGESTRRFVRGDWDRTPRLMEALAGLDVEVVATLNDVQLDGLRVPDNVHTMDWVPLTQLLPTCSAIIHHGGGGTVCAAIATGLPQLVCDTEESILMKVANDGLDHSGAGSGTYATAREFGIREESSQHIEWVMPAKKVEATPCSQFVMEHGAGVRLNHRAQSIPELRASILDVVDNPSYQDGADDLYRAWRGMPSPGDIVSTLEQLTAERRVWPWPLRHRRWRSQS